MKKRVMVLLTLAVVSAGGCNLAPNDEHGSTRSSTLAEAFDISLPSPSISPTPTPTPDPSPSSTSTDSDTTDPSGDEQSSCSPEKARKVVQDFFLDRGFRRSEVRVGMGEVRFKGAPQERGSASFGFRTLRSREDVSELLHRNSKARAQIWKALHMRHGEFQRAMKGKGYIPAQLTVPIVIEGTTYILDGKVMTSDARRAEALDVFWIYVTRKCQLVRKASIRADCSNPKFKNITPLRHKGGIPSVTKPPQLPHQPTGELPEKDPSQHPNNMNVDEGGQGSGGDHGSSHENNNADEGTGCNSNGCNGEGTEPKPPKDPPPASDGADDHQDTDQAEDEHEEEPPNPF